MNLKLDKFGAFGTIVAAAACPICFPKLALIGALVGLGVLAEYEYYFYIAFQVLALVTFTGVLLTYRIQRNLKILILAFASVTLFFVSLYLVANEYLSYLALAGLVASVIWQLVEAKKCSNLPQAKRSEG
jgi:mercuric ion transport protein